MAKNRKKKHKVQYHENSSLLPFKLAFACVFGLGALAAGNKIAEQQISEPEYVVSSEGITQEDEEALQRMIHSMEMERYEPVAAPQAPEKPSKPVTAPKGSKIAYMVRNAAEANGVDPELFHGLVLTESGGNPNVKPSSAGAIGLAQLTPATAKDLGVNPHNARENLKGGAEKLADDTRRFGSETLALIAYNMGSGGTERWLKRGGDCSKLPRETREYVGKVHCNAAVAAWKSQNQQLAMRE